MKNVFSILILSLLLNTFILSQTNWLAIPSGTNASLQAVHFSALNSGFIVGDSGTILKTIDAGLSWQNVSYSNPVLLYDVHVFNQNIVVAVGSGGLILKSIDGGANWNVVQSNVSEELYSVTFNGNVGICGGGSQTILYSTDMGSTWSISQTGFFGGSFQGTAMLSPQFGFVAGDNSIFQPLFGKSTDAGINWDFTSFYLNNNEGKATSIEFTDLNTGYLTASVWDGTGAISRTTDGGNNWLTTMVAQPMQEIHFPISGASLKGYAVGDFGTILFTWDAGLSWLTSISGTSERLNGVYFIDLELGIVVGEQGTILRTTNGGLPVELTSFTGRGVNDDAFLDWTTATELNNRGFEIQKFVAGSWATIGFVEGNGTSTEPINYSFNDKNLETGFYKYRLKQIDFNGSFELSKSVEIKITTPIEFALFQNYPNPFNPTTNIKYAVGSRQFVTLKVYNLLGKEVVTLVNGYREAGNFEINFDASSLPSGVYLYKLQSGELIQTKKLTLVK